MIYIDTVYKSKLVCTDSFSVAIITGARYFIKINSLFSSQFWGLESMELISVGL